MGGLGRSKYGKFWSHKWAMPPFRHFCTNRHEFWYPGLKLNFTATLFYKKNHFDQPFPRKRPPFFSQKTAKNGYFWKNWILGPKRPPRGASPTWNMYLYGGHLFQPFWTKKIQPGRQEGPKTAKMGCFWRYQNTPQNSHQTGQFGWNRYIGTLNLS